MPFREIRVEQIAGSQYSGHGAISPNGKSLALVLDDQGRNGLWIRNLSTNEQKELVPPAQGMFVGLTFSPDSSRVFYVSGKGEFATSLYEVSASGGETRHVLDAVHGPITFSPDGERFAFVRVWDEGLMTALVMSNTDGSGERELKRRTFPEYFNHAAPSWSPDGKLIACPAGYGEGERYSNLVKVQVDTGEEQPISSHRWGKVEQVAWLSDGTGLMMIASEKRLGSSQIWHLSYPDGALRRITNDLNGYNRLTLSADSKSLVTARVQTRSAIWQVSEQGTSAARQITDEGAGNFRDISWLRDGRLAFTSTFNGDLEVWIVNGNGSGLKQLTADGYPKFRPSESADGKYIVFASRGPDAHHIWRMEADGSNPQQLTFGVGENWPSCTPDGWVVYAGGPLNEKTLWKVPVQGGKPVQITDKPSNFPRVSPDGKQIACWYKDDPAARWKIAILAFDGRSVVRTIEMPLNPDLRWTTDGRSLNYIVTRNRVSNLWGQPIDGGSPHQVTNFSSLQINAFDWTRDGTLIATRGFAVRDLILITDAR
jgi:Tol biopolymer transport system component